MQASTAHASTAKDSTAEKMPYKGYDMPHVVIEVNQRCNISCAACYKNKSNYTKPLEQIRQEIDFAAQQRNLSVITLAGGEPSLHPQLAEVIRYIVSKGITAQILSNGLALTDERLAEYRKAGLRAIFLHIDIMQQRPDAPPATHERELNHLRATLGQRVRRHGINCFLQCTIYRENLADVPEVVEFVLANPQFPRLLVTCYTDFSDIFARTTGGDVLGTDVAALLSALGTRQPKPLESTDGEQRKVRNAEIKQLLHETHGMLPFGYIASNKSGSEQRWILYYSFVIRHPSGALHMLHSPPSFGRLANRWNARIKRHGKPYSFENLLTSTQSVVTCIAQALASLNPLFMLKTAGFLLQLLKPGTRIDHKSFCFQEGPSVTAKGELEYCLDCPDATVRDGRLVPVCMVDFLSPLPQ